MPDTTTYPTLTNCTNAALVFKLRTYNQVLPPSGKEKNIPEASSDEFFFYAEQPKFYFI